MPSRSRPSRPARAGRRLRGSFQSNDPRAGGGPLPPGPSTSLSGRALIQWRGGPPGGQPFLRRALMKAEILSIGSEITSGQNLDTNSQWLSQRLAEIGISVGWHTTVADDLEDNIAAFRIATQRSQLVVATGGLGPTQDDLTREALARLANVPLVLHEESLTPIRELFARRNRQMPATNQVQAMFPQGAEPLDNAAGTAPGIRMTVGTCVVACMPGVPSEMHKMFEEQVKPR